MLSYTTMVDNGPSSNRVDVVFLGDGYTTAEIGSTYVAHINAMLNHMFNDGEEPFVRYKNFFDVHRVDVISNESGADNPVAGEFHDTALDARYYYDGVTQRLLYINDAKANAALSAGLAGAGFDAEMKFVTVNDDLYGGGGGSYAVYAGASSTAPEIALHEQGHSFSHLADEYGDNSAPYAGPEPTEINVTTNSAGSKWSQWIGYNQPGIGVIGAYEGGRYYAQGIYRPSLNSKMRALGQPFDAVSREQIILDIYKYVDPLDSWLSNSATVTGANPSLWVDTVDSSVISMQWMVNGTVVPNATGETFKLGDYGYGAGTYTITARAYDPTDWVRRDKSNLEESITWSVTSTAGVPVQGEWTDVQTADFNGDGKSDLAGRANGQWWVSLSTGSGFTTQSWGEWDANSTWNDIHAADVTGDGRADIVGRTANGQWWVAASTGGGFQNAVWGAWAPGVPWTDVTPTDVTGDGKADIIGRVYGQWWVGVSTGSGFQNQLWGAWSTSVTWDDVQVVDLTSDGRADVVGRTGGQWWVSRSTGAALQNELWGGWAPEVVWQNVQAADMNGDGRNDIVGRTGGQWWVGISTGAAFKNELWGGWAPEVTWEDVQSADVNGDGRDDLLGRANGIWWVGRSTGAMLTNQAWSVWDGSVAWKDVTAAYFTGDGRADIAGRAGNTWWVGVSTGASFVNQIWGVWGNSKDSQAAQPETAEATQDPAVALLADALAHDHVFATPVAAPAPRADVESAIIGATLDAMTKRAPRLDHQAGSSEIEALDTVLANWA